MVKAEFAGTLNTDEVKNVVLKFCLFKCFLEYHSVKLVFPEKFELFCVICKDTNNKRWLLWPKVHSLP